MQFYDSGNMLNIIETDFYDKPLYKNYKISMNFQSEPYSLKVKPR